MVGDKQRSYCRVRENRGGRYYSLVYGRPCALHTDPIEKKPFFHVYPGSQAFSIATVGCNMACKFCQNWDMYPLSHPKPDKFVIPQPSGGIDPNGLSKLRPYIGRDLASRHFATQ